MSVLPVAGIPVTRRRRRDEDRFRVRPFPFGRLIDSSLTDALMPGVVGPTRSAESRRRRAGTASKIG